jgi:adenylate cyclase
MERRLTVILAADVVGYSALMERDEAGTYARLKAGREELFEPQIEHHHGRIFKIMGDGLLAEFSSVVNAVECAVALQHGLAERNAVTAEEQRILLRIGINIGEVIVEGNDRYGEGVNVASRLEQLAEPGGIWVSAKVAKEVEKKLAFGFERMGAQKVKNIAEPIEAFRVNVASSARRLAPQSFDPVRDWRAIAVIIAVLMVGLVVFGYTQWGERWPSSAEPQAARLSLVVLPFTNLSNDPSQDYFADGITENLTTDLSRIPSSFVIARNTAFTFKGKNIDVKQVGKELGVRYVLEGSVQRDQNRVRVNAQLIDATTGAHIWADRFEDDVADLFKLQDEVVARLANSLGYELVKAEAKNSVGSKNPDAIDLELRGRALFLTRFQQGVDYKKIAQEAQNLFDQALAIDPSNADALAGSAFTYFVQYYYGWRPEVTDYDAKVLAQADRAISLDPNNMQAYYAKNFYLNATHRAKDALRAADQGLAIDPNNASLYNARGYSKINLGQFEEAKSDILKAMKLSPRDPQMGLWKANLADAEMGLGNYEAAIHLVQNAIDSGFRTSYSYRELAAAYALAGKTEEAKTALAAALKFTPKLTIKSVERTNPVSIVLEGLRKAGLKEE